jgi:hypothetical protein
MKVKHRNNLIRLIFLHLLLLAYPLVSKTFHVHHNDEVQNHFSANPCFGQVEDFCPVCDFEFYNFVPSQLITVSVAPISISVFDTSAPQAIYLSCKQYFSLRAPPVS